MPEKSYSYPSNPQPEFGPPLTERRVREIFAEMLAAHGKPDDWRAKCRAVRYGSHWELHSPSGRYELRLDGTWADNHVEPVDEGHFPTYGDIDPVFAKAPPPPDVDAEPDWKGLCKALAKTVEVIRDKAQQYYNENAPGDTEFRGLMGFVYDTANGPALAAARKGLK